MQNRSTPGLGFLINILTNSVFLLSVLTKIKYLDLEGNRYFD